MSQFLLYLICTHYIFGGEIVSYEKAYYKLFNEITDALTVFEMALFSLKEVQCQAEQMIIANESNEEN